MRVVLAFLVCAACVLGDTSVGSKRQKRLLFYDENGNLVKTYSSPYPNNPYLQNLRLNAGHLPYYGSFLNPFFGFIKDFGNIFTLTIPVSNEVIQQIQKDPDYHNKLMITPTKDPVIEPNALCEGRRTQIPSPSLCNNYLNCWDGWAVEQECPTGLLFSNLGYCDYSDNVNCESRKLIQPPPTQPQCKKDFEAFRNAFDCNEFFICVGRQPVKFKCPADLAYNQFLGVCDYPTRVDCSSTATNTGVFASQSTAQPSPTPAPFAPTAAIIPPAIVQPIAPPGPIPPAVVNPPAQTAPAASVAPPAPIAPSVPLAPSIPIAPPIPIAPVVPIASSEPFEPSPASPAPGTIPPSFISSPSPGISTRPLPVYEDGDLKTIFSENSIVNTQSWTSTHVAMSRQDAIRQLQRTIAKLDV
ncbi:unnamed protein product [Chrysodeixis includens]|uniref:Chitin-binding type-2 domain-containing protein n=1 Tax=Chrysodeixis includens TaxID=689277 RepID=A0A9P0FY95_CHRIL|nr:unnamed protein product [Chrysodeixis includens]